VIWVTDEEHGDGDVRCEPGRYIHTDDGTEYVPGRLCDWVSDYENLIDVVERNSRVNSKVHKYNTLAFCILKMNVF